MEPTLKKVVNFAKEKAVEETKSTKTAKPAAKSNTSMVGTKS